MPATGSLSETLHMQYQKIQASSGRCQTIALGNKALGTKNDLGTGTLETEDECTIGRAIIQGDKEGVCTYWRAFCLRGKSFSGW